MSSTESTASWDDLDPVAGLVWELSQEPLGCRRVQAALESASSEEARVALAQELRGHVLKASRCPHANHVLQKCILTMRPESLQFIVDELLEREESVMQVAKHRFGSRVLQHLLSSCPMSQVSKIAEIVEARAGVLSCHTFGNYVVQRLLEFGTEEQRYRVVRCIERHATCIGLSPVGGEVIASAMKHSAPEDRVWVARAAAQDPKVLLTLAQARQGHGSVLLVLETLEGRELQRIRADLAQHLDELRASRFGRRVVKELGMDVACIQG